MAAKKRSSKKSSAKKSASSSAPNPNSVVVALDSEQILLLKTAIETLSEFATAIATASDDPVVKGSANAKKSARKSAKKKSSKK